ncbi:acetyl-CoA hydrolase/transferase C-terminal domain-containing protein [Novosphingobium sp. ST904]|uniref:acetyl-CoA hydrolase/transferase family protein n=1 Tax=Novosphingobium sp. ST904 TaxID=1684385 RepID=UPI0006C865D1|nr:acetyl-CoA hydrolase/transferase C-terminal domain-containing protein [Novosphingobium sp. ST904]KPH60627.1 4-hydroxybutyrate CoA-transferase [Novosphingobium sp. ST904]TCM39370.1 itaconate CoA-transferase [Novosphingobium sp. ST904]
MDAGQIYAAKLTTADRAVMAIESDSDLAMGMAVGEPPAILAALARRAEAGTLSDLRVWYLLSQVHSGSTILRRELLGRIRPRCLFMSGIERALIKADPAAEALIDFVPCAFSGSPRLLRDEIELDACVLAVSPMDENGFFSFGAANDYTSVAAHCARTVIVEVNPAMPRVACSTPLHVSQVSAIVENHVPLLSFGEAAGSPEDEAIAALIAEMIDDGACLQMGIGNLPAAVCRRIEDRRDLGIHTELLTPAMAGLVHSGAVSNRLKTTHPGRSVYSFAMGDEPFYRWMDGNPQVYSLPVDVVNDASEIARNDNVVSVNATIQVDLHGACNSEFMGGRQYSAAGGQLDFVRGASASKGGVSIIACRSTAQGGTVSRIVPKLDGPVTTPRNDVHWIVTEHGAANLRGKTLRERAELLIGLADPKFRDELARGL